MPYVGFESRQQAAPQPPEDCESTSLIERHVEEGVLRPSQVRELVQSRKRTRRPKDPRPRRALLVIAQQKPHSHLRSIIASIGACSTSLS